MLFWILLGVAVFVILAVLLISYICFRMAFYSPDRPKAKSDAIDIPKGEAYMPFRETLETWTREARSMPHEDVSITSFDGLKLTGKYYEYAPGAPIELMFHGYRGTAERDLSGGVQRCFQLGRSALLVDQRGCSTSGGNILTFGIRERRDCLAWVDFMLRRFGPEVKIILTGISMGAATVLMAAAEPLPDNVIGVLADCGYSSARDIIRVVIRNMGLPVGPSYWFVRLGAKLYGRFDPEETSPVQAMEHCILPVIFFHGEADDFVPCEMSKINFDACTARKKLVTLPGAAHGLSYPVAPEAYLQALREFFGPEASCTK